MISMHYGRLSHPGETYFKRAAPTGKDYLFFSRGQDQASQRPAARGFTTMSGFRCRTIKAPRSRALLIPSGIRTIYKEIGVKINVYDPPAETAQHEDPRPDLGPLKESRR
jgi:hypothetical protein